MGYVILICKPARAIYKLEGNHLVVVISFCSKLGDIIVRVMDSRSTGLGSSLDLGHCVVFLAKALLSHSTCLYMPGCKKVTKHQGICCKDMSQENVAMTKSGTVLKGGGGGGDMKEGMIPPQYM